MTRLDCIDGVVRLDVWNCCILPSNVHESFEQNARMHNHFCFVLGSHSQNIATKLIKSFIYENTPIQIYWNFYHKIWNVSDKKKSDIFS